MVKKENPISYYEMCLQEGRSLQAGMNYRTKNGYSILLMNAGLLAPYRDAVDKASKKIVYEGHDVPKTKEGPNPKSVDQPLLTDAGTPTQNAYFYMAAWEYKKGYRPAERVRIYEKIERGLWRDLGMFLLVNAFIVHDGRRRVFRFELEPEQVG